MKTLFLPLILAVSTLVSAQTATSNATFNADGTITITTVVTPPAVVTPPPDLKPTVSITQDSTSMVVGGSATLTVAATNATSVKLVGTNGSVRTLPEHGSSVVVHPASTTTYTATAIGNGESVSASATVTVQAVIPEGTTVSNIQADTSRWEYYGQVGPDYVDCGPSPCEGISFSMKTGITSPSLSNNAARFDLGGTTNYGDALFNAAVIGKRAVLQDTDHALLPTLHNYIYETDFYVANAAVTHALEFDISVWMDKTAGMTFGTQCSHLGDKSWDIYDNGTGKWITTGNPCNFVNGWNHLKIQVERQADNSTLYKSITLNGTTYTLNKSYPPKKSPASWWGVNVNFQLDGDSKHDAYTAYLDNLSLTYF